VVSIDRLIGRNGRILNEWKWNGMEWNGMELKMNGNEMEWSNKQRI